MRPKIPIYIDISGFHILVLGGGEEATKKVRRYAVYTDNITVYSMEFREELIELSREHGVKLIRGDVRDWSSVDELIKESDLIIYTIPGIDTAEAWVKDRCEEYRKLYILSTNAAETMAAMPHETEIHGLRITAFSDGKSSLVSMEVLDIIREFLSEKAYLETLTEAMYYLKRHMRSKGVDYKTRMMIYRRIFRDPIFRSYVHNNDSSGAKNYIEGYVERVAEDEG